MGQFLALGLMNEMIISRDDLKKKKISKKELRQEIEKNLLFDLKLYDETETDDGYLLLTLKNEVLEKDLIPFLEAIYPKIFEDNDKYYLDILKRLRSTPSSEWLDLAKEKSNYAFRFDEYGEASYITFLEKDFCPSIRIKFNSLMLFLGDGKILTEGIEEFLRFYKYCIHETFKEHQIVKSVRVYITG